jgi:hypothetical protein
MPEVNHRYVLFLKRFDKDSFSIITGYELRDGKVYALDNEASQFRAHEGSDELPFLEQVKLTTRKVRRVVELRTSYMYQCHPDESPILL